MPVQKSLIALVLTALAISGVGAYAMVANASSPEAKAVAPAEEGALVENIRFDNAVLFGVHKGDLPAVLYGLVSYDDEHTTALVYVFLFAGIAEVGNRSLIAYATCRNTTWANTDFHIIKHKGRPVGLLMGFRNEGPLYVEFTNSSYGESGYYNVSIRIALIALYSPRLKETVFATYRTGENSSSWVVYDVKGGVVLAAGFRVEGWPLSSEDSFLAAGFWIYLRGRAWLDTEEGRTKANVRWVVPFCGRSRPRLQARSGLVRGTFLFVNRAVIRENGSEEPEVVRAYCLYMIRGHLLRLAIVVPGADVVRYPALRR